MRQRELVALVESFLASYREAFERADAAAVAEHFGESVHVASDTGSGVHVEFMTGATWRSAIEQLLARYRALGVSRAEPQKLEVVCVSERLALANVYWVLSNRERHVLYEFHALYTLMNDGARWRIVAIAHDEVLQARRLGR